MEVFFVICVFMVLALLVYTLITLPGSSNHHHEKKPKTWGDFFFH